MKKYIKKEYIISFITAILFSMAFVLKNEINYNGNFPTNFINNFHFNLTFIFKSLLLSILIFIINIVLFKCLDKIKLNKTNWFSNKKVFVISLIGLLITGLLMLISFYPGNVMIDTMYIFRSPLSNSSQHPLLYIILVTVPFKVFTYIFNSQNIAVFLTCLLQLTITSIIISLIIVWFNNTFKHKYFTIILMLYFIFLPIITNYNITLVKDSIFCIAILALIPIIYELIDTKGEFINNKKNFIIAFIIFAFASLIRNNGIYVIILLIIILSIVFKKHIKYWIFLLILIIITFFISSYFSNKALFQEKVGVLLQQISYTIYTDGKISKKDKEFLNNIYDLNLYKENYNPMFVDTIKWDHKFNRKYLDNNSSKFINVWIRMLPNNFEGYVKSYLLTTYGNWSFDKFYDYQSNFFGVEDTNDKMFPQIENKNILPKNLQTFYKNTCKYLSGGVCFWILIFISSYIIYKRKYILLLLTVPLYGLWLSLMVASPLSIAFRYMSPYMYVLPFNLLITIIKTRKGV